MITDHPHWYRNPNLYLKLSGKRKKCKYANIQNGRTCRRIEFTKDDPYLKVGGNFKIYKSS